jgi:tartrate-resistant acid phosphatase type 5
MKALPNVAIGIAVAGLGLLACAYGAYAYVQTVPSLSFAKEVDHKGTSPESELQKLTLLTMGDWGSGSQSQKTTAVVLEKLCVERSADAVVLLGDNFYMHGVQSVTDELWKTRWKDIYGGPCLSRIPFYVSLGNHDYDGNAEAQIRYSEVEPGHWIMPARAFTVRFGKLLTLTNMDTNYPEKCWIPGLCSLDWLQRSLDESTPSRWRIAVGHHPVMSGGKHKRLNPYARWTVPPFLCKNAFDMYWAGHDHALEHLEGRTRDIDCDIRQMVLGGGGGDLYSVTAMNPQTKFKLSSNGVGVGVFTPAKVTMEIVSAPFGEVVHSFSFDKSTPIGSRH